MLKNPALLRQFNTPNKYKKTETQPPDTNLGPDSLILPEKAASNFPNFTRTRPLNPSLASREVAHKYNNERNI